MPTRAGPSHRARFQPVSLSTIWSTVVQHLTPPSHPSTTSESAHGGGSSFNHTDIYYGESLTGQHLPLELLNPTSHPSRRKPLSRKRGAAKSSGAASNSRYGGDDEDINQSIEPVSHTVVENDFEEFTPPAPRSDGGSTGHTPGQSNTGGRSGGGGRQWTKSDEGETGLIIGKDHAAREAKSEVSVLDTASTWAHKIPGYELVVDTVWPAIAHFFDSSFPEPAKERSFQKEAWFSQKQGAMMSSAYFLISWALTVGLLPLPLTRFNWWAYFGFAGIFILPIPFFVIFDFPRRHPLIWQPFLLGATWALSDVLVGEMFDCGFFHTGHNTCGTRNFLNFFGFAFGLPTLSILALRQSRILATLGAAQWLIIVGVLLVRQGGAPRLFYRNMVNFGLYHAFLIGTAFFRERSDRQMFALRQQLKIQYRATQSAQVMEKRASDSKKRFVSYIFHEVRVPLNTALLAVQNLEGENVFRGLEEDQSEMVHGLMGSLTMMEKVLNDVLSFNRMESGKFAQARKPFEFHKSIQLVALSHRMQAQMAGIQLIVDLDKDIDKIGGVFIGDEMRLRQVASNLVSNSIKFTDSGSVRIVTKLLYPRLEPTPGVEIDDPLRQAAVNLQVAQMMEDATRSERRDSASPDHQQDLEKGSVRMESNRLSSASMRGRDADRERDEESRRKRKAVVRVEIHDTGVGLKKADIIDNRLFSPYVQTEIGRRQGGKGSGLGLALVRQIVKLSNGRLGVESEFGKGSMFWFELPYSLPPPPRNGSRDTSLGGNGSKSPMLSRTPTVPPSLTVPTLGMIKETSNDANRSRPEMVPTDSTLPLLPEAHGRRRRSSDMVHEEAISQTFPPIESSSDNETPSDIVFVGTEMNKDPFRSESTGRRSSEVSSDKRLLSPNDPALLVPTLPSASQPLPSPDLPLCALVVDDDKLTRMLMSRMLTRLGHTVTTAENGKLALDMIKASFEGRANTPTFDVVFLDNQMPLMSGVEVAREVREMKCPLFIVGCTGNALREDQDEYIAAGADEIIPKPIHQKAVMEMIREARKRVRGETRPKDLDGEGGPR